MIDPFPERYRRALADPDLERTILEFQRNWRASRERAVAAIDFESLRSRLKEIKDGVVADLPGYVDRFEAAARLQGATVFRASTPEDAARYIADLASSRGVQRVVKSKSMVSEEIELNAQLDSAGVQVVETDLGEWIVQLAGEKPAHIIGPALHKSRHQVADLFERYTGETVDHEDITAQVNVARRALGSEFGAAQLGISGANALIAETGSIVLVTNEGNAELVSTLPRIQVVLAGIEKIVPTVDDAMTLLQILGPSATGQPATSYVSMFAGPTGPGHELHIVLLDNRRTAMRDSADFHDALRCIRCGACADACPPFGVVGGHVFGYIYSGAIGLVNTPFHHGLEEDAGPQSLCVSCNACQTVCPVDIPLPRQILDTRAEVAAGTGAGRQDAALMAIWSRPALFRTLARAGGTLQRPVQKGPFVRPPGMSRLTSWRELPALARRPFRDRIDTSRGQPIEGDLGTRLAGLSITYFIQCLTDWLYPEIGESILSVLTALGAHVVVPRAQHCCGLPAIDSGHRNAARRMARQTIETLEMCDSDWIVSGGTSCVIAMAHDYAHLFQDEPEWAARAARLAPRIRDFTTFMLDVVGLRAGSLAGEPGQAAYHYFCQSYNVLGFREEPRRLLSDVCGLELKPLAEANVCCGFGGSVSFKRPEICSRILRRKLGNVEATGVPLLITDNPGCIMHLRGGMAASGRRVEVRHTAELVAKRVLSSRFER